MAPATPEAITALCPMISGERAVNLSNALTVCMDSRDVDDRAARTRDSWLCWDFGFYQSALSKASAQRVAA